MPNRKIVDHLFRHQYGKMVSILTGIFGLSNLELVEDAVQDTFTQALNKWKYKIPPNPEAWLTQAAKNRAVDLLRQIKSEKGRLERIMSGPAAFQLNDLFLDHEVEDSQLRMIFVACHPKLDPKEQLAFSLKTISGFSTREIAAALLIKEETVKKRLARARKKVAKDNITFDFPGPKELPQRLSRIMEVIYLIFNEGFHSSHPEQLVRQDLCGEAMRLGKLLLKKEKFRSGSLYALVGLMCFHAARLESKTNEQGEVVSLRYQDRNQWLKPLADLGSSLLSKALEYEEVSPYHYEAFIAYEHLNAPTFEATCWSKILRCYKKLYELHPTASTTLNMAMVHIQLEEFKAAKKLLDSIEADTLGQRAYLLYGCYAEYYKQKKQPKKALPYMEQAIASCTNQLEKEHLKKEKAKLAALI